jgi:hypothetical protein
MLIFPKASVSPRIIVEVYVRVKFVVSYISSKD